MADITRAELLRHCIRVVEDQLAAGIERSARGVYYDLVGEGVIEQDRPDADGNPTRKNYSRVISTIAKAKLAGDFPLEWLRDDLRPVHSGSVTSASEDLEEAYGEVVSYLRWFPRQFIRADRWYRQPVIPVVICEKDTLVGTIRRPCEQAEVPWYVCRGYSSITGLYALADYLRGLQDDMDWSHEIEVLYLGDHDPEGLNIPEAAANVIGQVYDLKGWDDPPTRWTRIALTYAQALGLGAPAMPVKVSSSRAAGYIEQYGHDAWEIEAMPSRRLQSILIDALADRYDDGVRAAVTADHARLRDEMRARLRSDCGSFGIAAFGDPDADR